MVGVPCFFAEILCVQAHEHLHEKKTSVLISTMSSVPNTPSPQPPDLPPLPPLVATYHETVNVASATSNSHASSNANVNNSVDALFASLPENSAGGDVDFLGEGCPDDNPETTTPLSRPLFDVPNPFLHVNEDNSPERADAPRGSIFPSTIPTIQNRFFNQNSALNDEGYDSEGGLPYFADEEEVDNATQYFEEPLVNSVEGPTSAAATSTVAPAGAAAVGLTVEMMMSLKAMELKEELRKRGRPILGKKADLQARLREAILQNVPVAVGNEARRHDSMTGLDLTAEWVLLTPEDEPFPQPVNVDESLRPPTEMDAGVTYPKFAIKETFERGFFTGTTTKMRYNVGPHESPTNCVRPPKKRARKGRKLSPTRRQVVTSSPSQGSMVGQAPTS
jgi:hypothetical protein